MKSTKELIDEFGYSYHEQNDFPEVMEKMVEKIETYIKHSPLSLWHHTPGSSG